MDTRDREYERFGPWIDEVTDPQDVPPLFRRYLPDPGQSRLVLKVPRDIARRDARPGMDLYDRLLILSDSQFTVLSRVPGQAHLDAGVTVAAVDLADLVAVHRTVSLLRGELRVLARPGVTMTVPFNGSGREQIDRLVAHLQVELGSGEPSRVGLALLMTARSSLPDPLGDVTVPTEPGVVSDLRAARQARPLLQPWAWHARRRVEPRSGGLTGVVTRVGHLLSPMTLPAAVLASDGCTLDVIGRQAWLVRGTGPDYSSGHLLLGLRGLDELTVAPHPDYHGVAQARFTAGNVAVPLDIPQDSPAHRLLTQAATS